MKNREKRNGKEGAAVERLKRPLTTRNVLGVSFGEESIAARWLWHYRKLIAVRNRLLEERGERFKDATEQLEPHSMDFADSATDEFDHDLTLAAISAEQDVLYEVEEALNRIKNGKYGFCEETGEAIPSERLRAIPWTRFGREVESRLEAEHAISKPHLGALGSVRTALTGALEESEIDGKEESAPAEDEALREQSVPREKVGQTQSATATKARRSCEPNGKNRHKQPRRAR